MSTLPFLLSVADELDNIHSQSYMDDFGLGFHPHRQYYRSPTIQLSLPASTDWMQGRQARYRSYKFYDDSQNNAVEEQEEQEEEQQPWQDLPAAPLPASSPAVSAAASVNAAVAAAAAAAHTASLVNSNSSNSHDVGVGGLGLNLKSGGDDDDENIDRTVRMYNLSKKCCKNYYRHALETGPGASGRIKCSNAAPAESQPSSSSSEESLQKVASPIEFLTCFLVKKSRAPKCGASCSRHSHNSNNSHNGQLDKEREREREKKKT